MYWEGSANTNAKWVNNKEFLKDLWIIITASN